MTDKEIRVLFDLLEKHNKQYENAKKIAEETGNIFDLIDANRLINRWLAISEAFDALGLTAKIDKGEV